MQRRKSGVLFGVLGLTVIASVLLSGVFVAGYLTEFGLIPVGAELIVYAGVGAGALLLSFPGFVFLWMADVVSELAAMREALVAAARPAGGAMSPMRSDPPPLRAPIGPIAGDLDARAGDRSRGRGFEQHNGYAAAGPRDAYSNGDAHGLNGHERPLRLNGEALNGHAPERGPSHADVGHGRSNGAETPLRSQRADDARAINGYGGDRARFDAASPRAEPGRGARADDAPARMNGEATYDRREAPRRERRADPDMSAIERNGRPLRRPPPPLRDPAAELDALLREQERRGRRDDDDAAPLSSGRIPY